MAAWVWPRPPAKPNFLTHPPFDSLNRMTAPLKPGEVFTAYHAAGNFTRFYGSIACDQSLETSFIFSNDEVSSDGHWVTDETLPMLHYDAEAMKLAFDPNKPSATGKFLVTIYGRWLKVEVKNTGKAPTEWMRVYVRGSVF